MTVLTKTAEVEAFVQRARGAPYLTIDTEFMREKTYYAKLCLIQAATRDEAVIIDPLSEHVDLSSFFDLLTDTRTIKVFHAARQDLEIFLQLAGALPEPLFDTQIAAMVFGYGDQVGYEPLVRDLTGKKIDKGSRFTDWARRPLSEKQLDYALGDVTHLRDVYEKLLEKLERTGRRGWVEEEMRSLLDPSLYFIKPEDAWKRLKLRNVRSKELGPLIELARWREKEAQERDVPRGRIVKDDVLFDVARVQPRTVEELGSLRSIPQGFERSATARGLLEAVARGQDIPKSDLPSTDEQAREPGPPDVVELLRVLMKRQCENFDVAPKLLASAADLDALALDDDADIPALKGWRREVFGELALRLKRGEIALSLRGRRVEIVQTTD